MSDSLEQEEVSTSRKRGRRPSTIQDLFVPDEVERERGDVVLRKIVAADGFERTVSCRRGMITVLPGGAQNQSYDVFRNALLGRKGGEHVSMRLGQHKLHSSEIHTVIPSEVVAPNRTVEDALKRGGVAEEEINEVAMAVGIDKYLKEKTDAVAPKIVSRLTTAVAVWSRARIVYLDAPFKSVGNEWAPALAHFLLESILNSDRIMIIGGVEKLPRTWRSHSFVEVAGVEVGVYDGDVQVVDETMGYLRKIQHLIGSSSFDDGSLRTTYPQRIFRRRTPSDSAMCIEAITNPNLTDSEQNLYRVTPEVMGVDNPEKPKRKRKPTGKLTRVTRLQKLRSRSMVLALRSMLARNQTRLKEEPVLAQYRIQRAKEEQSRRQQLELMLLILILLMTAMLLLNWL